jgi:hypothetical protein
MYRTIWRCDETVRGAGEREGKSGEREGRGRTAAFCLDILQHLLGLQILFDLRGFLWMLLVKSVFFLVSCRFLEDAKGGGGFPHTHPSCLASDELVRPRFLRFLLSLFGTFFSHLFAQFLQLLLFLLLREWFDLERFRQYRRVASANQVREKQRSNN